MKTLFRSILSLLAAALVPAGAVLIPVAVDLWRIAQAGDRYAWTHFQTLALFVLVPAFMYVLVLGVPVFLIMRWRQAIRWWSSIVAGFVVGLVPTAVSLWPGGNEGPGNMKSHSDGERIIHTMVDGVTTRAGWLQYVETVGMVGLLGALGGLASWVVWWSMRSNKTMEPTR
jgi:hypothetical protein